MSPQPRTRHQKRIVEVLRQYGGALEDPNGQAVALLMAETGHRTTNALSGVLAQMERENLITREVKGRRTYSIRLADSVETPPVRIAAPAEPSDAPDMTGVDYDMLAGVLFKKVLVAMNATEDLGRLRQAERRAADLQAELDDAKADLKLVRDELAEAKAVIKTLEHNNKVLAGQMDKVRKNEGTPVSQLISKAEQRELEKLMRSLPSIRG